MNLLDNKTADPKTLAKNGMVGKSGRINLKVGLSMSYWNDERLRLSLKKRRLKYGREHTKFSFMWCLRCQGYTFI